MPELSATGAEAGDKHRPGGGPGAGKGGGGARGPRSARGPMTTRCRALPCSAGGRRGVTGKGADLPSTPGRLSRQ